MKLFDKKKKKEKCSTCKFSDKIDKALEKIEEATILLKEEKEDEDVRTRQQHKISEARG